MKTLSSITRLLCLAFLVVTGVGCDTGVQESPEPGVLRVTMQADPADTTIVIAGQVLTVSPSDSFGVTIYQGRAFRDTLFAVLLKSTTSYRERDYVYNVFQRDGSEFAEFVIFESLLPPGDYDSLRFSASAEMLSIGSFLIPVRLPPDAEPAMDFPARFQIAERDTTEIKVMLRPLESVRRFRDMYLFHRQFEVTHIENPS